MHVRPLRRPATPGETKASDLRKYLSPGKGSFLAPHHRPPLAGIKLVRPRPRLPARRCGRSSLTPVCATAQSSSNEEKPTSQSRAQARRPGQGHRVNLPCPLDSRGPHGCGNRTQRDAVRRNRRARHSECRGSDSLAPRRGRQYQAQFPDSCGEAGMRRASNRLMRGNLVRYRDGRNSRVT